MKKKIHPVVIAASLALTMGGLSAKTVAWYHFNEGENGTKPTSSGTAVFENAADHGSLMGVPYAINANSTVLNTYASYRPAYSNAFPVCATWHDPATGARGEDSRCLYVQSSNKDGSGQAGVVFVEDDPKLRCANITVELMVKLDLPETVASLKNWAHIIMMRNAAKSNIKAWGLHINTIGTVNLQVQRRDATGEAVDSGNNVSITAGSVNVVDGKWHHIAFTYDGSTLRLYVDYIQQTSKAYTGGIDYNEDGNGRLCICGNDKANYGRWQGFVDEVRISDEALQPEQFLRPGSFTGKAASVTDGDTAIYLSFDSVQMCEDQFFGTVDAPIVFNETMATNALKIGVVLAKDGILPDVETEDVAANILHAGILATSSLANGGCWKFGKNTAVEGKSIHMMVNDYANNGNTHLISSGDFTIEFWINVPEVPPRACYIIAEQSATKGPGTLLMYTTANGYMYCRLVSQAALDGYETNNVALTYNDAYKSGIFDGKWHHVALVVDRAHKLATYYVDHELVRQHTDFVLASSVASSADYKPFQISGGWGPNRQDEFHNLLIDELRITRRALAPQEFLARGENGTAALAPTRAWIDFEGDLAVEPRPDEIPAGVKSAAVEYSPSVPGCRILDGNGEIIRATNSSSMKWSGSGNTFFARNILLERDMASQTVEFFMKGTNGSARAWAYMVRMYNTAAADDTQGNRIWSVGYGNGSGDIYVSMDTTNIANQVKYFTGSNLDDGHWHHVALTFEPDGTGNTTVKLYKDYVQFGSEQKVVGLFQTALDGGVPYSSMVVGSASYDGWIDEVRITKGILAVDQMLHVQRRGAVLSIR